MQDKVHSFDNVQVPYIKTNQITTGVFHNSPDSHYQAYKINDQFDHFHLVKIVLIIPKYVVKNFQFTT